MVAIVTSSTPVVNHASRAISRPSAPIADVMPVFVARSIGRPSSSARIAAIWLCCSAAIEWPYHASFVTLTSNCASRAPKRNSVPNASS